MKHFTASIHSDPQTHLPSRREILVQWQGRGCKRFVIHMRDIWICVIGRVRLSGRYVSVLRTENFHVGHYEQTFEPNSSISSMVTGAPLSVTVTVVGFTRLAVSKTCWLRFLTLFFRPIRMKCDVVLKLNILMPLLRVIYRINNCGFTNSVTKRRGRRKKIYPKTNERETKTITTNKCLTCNRMFMNRKCSNWV